MENGACVLGLDLTTTAAQPRGARSNRRRREHRRPSIRSSLPWPRARLSSLLSLIVEHDARGAVLAAEAKFNCFPPAASLHE